MFIRRAKISDLEAILLLHKELTESHFKYDRSYYGMKSSKDTKSQTASRFSTCIRSRKHRILVAEENGKVIGFLHIIFETRPPIFEKRKSAFFEDLVVSARHRRKGVATALWREGERVANEKSCELIELASDVNNSALKFYEKCGAKSRQYKMVKIL